MNHSLKAALTNIISTDWESPYGGSVLALRLDVYFVDGRQTRHNLKWKGCIQNYIKHGIETFDSANGADQVRTLTYRKVRELYEDLIGYLKRYLTPAQLAREDHVKMILRLIRMLYVHDQYTISLEIDMRCKPGDRLAIIASYQGKDDVKLS